ncbi:hypothetical protein JCM6882_008602 [Rhodosporidiobolus microsporus]
MNRLTSSCTCSRASLTARLAPHASPAILPSFISRRAIHAPAAVEKTKRIPAPRAPYTDVTSILSASKRGLESYADKLGEWNDLFTKSGTELKDAGMTVKESRYLMWLLEQYRQGHDVAAVAVAPTPKKTIRGWGARVQLGKRIR